MVRPADRNTLNLEPLIMTRTIPADPMDILNEAARRMRVEDSAAKSVSMAKVKLFTSKTSTSVFFATLAMRLRWSVDWEAATAATDGRSVFYNPDFIDTLSQPAIQGLIVHEILHVSNRHATRRGERDPRKWNIACDLAINHILREAGYTLPSGGCFPGEGSFADMPLGLSSEAYYDLLPADAGEGEGSDPGGCGEVIDPTDAAGQPIDQAETASLEREIAVAVAAAQQSALKRGELSAGLQRLIDAILAPVVDWREQLRDYVRPAKRDYSMRRPNRRHVARGMYLPSLRSQELGDIVAAIDTSGSIGDATLRRFASELDAVASEGAKSITIVYHDADVVRVDKWTPEDGPLTLTPCGGGGTDHRPVFDWLAEQAELPELVILLTDLASSFPAQAPDVPVLWVSTWQGGTHPFGDRIDIPAE